eukprot:scaffold454067_cov37-Prasinocladus_malaysianus.AAC.1
MRIALPTTVHQVRCADGWEGAGDIGPFDAINVGAAAPTVPPALLRQLRPGGMLVVPIGPEQSSQKLTKVQRMVGTAPSPQAGSSRHDGDVDRADFEQTLLRTVRFVPLVDTQRQRHPAPETSSSKEGHNDSTLGKERVE